MLQLQVKVKQVGLPSAPEAPTNCTLHNSPHSCDSSKCMCIALPHPMASSITPKGMNFITTSSVIERFMSVLRENVHCDLTKGKVPKFLSAAPSLSKGRGIGKEREGLGLPVPPNSVGR